MSVAETIFGLDFFRPYIYIYSPAFINSCLKFSTALDISFHRKIQQKRNLEYITSYSTIVIVVLYKVVVIAAAVNTGGLYKAGRS